VIPVAKEHRFLDFLPSTVEKQETNEKLDFFFKMEKETRENVQGANKK
jgi:hypothetical protein